MNRKKKRLYDKSKTEKYQNNMHSLEAIEEHGGRPLKKDPDVYIQEGNKERNDAQHGQLFLENVKYLL